MPRRAPHNPRCFSPREAARLMGFPDSFELELPPRRGDGHQRGERALRKALYRLLGNAVCPPVIAALAGAVLAHVPPGALRGSAVGEGEERDKTGAGVGEEGAAAAKGAAGAAAGAAAAAAAGSRSTTTTTTTTTTSATLSQPGAETKAQAAATTLDWTDAGRTAAVRLALAARGPEKQWS